MIARPAWILKETFALYCLDIQAILDSVDFLENYEVIHTNSSSFCPYILTDKRKDTQYICQNIQYLT